MPQIRAIRLISGTSLSSKTDDFTMTGGPKYGELLANQLMLYVSCGVLTSVALRP